jgi:O-methyltransferase
MKHIDRFLEAEGKPRLPDTSNAGAFKFLRSWLRYLGGAVGVAAYAHRPSYHYVPDYFGRAAHKQIDIRQAPVFGELATEVIRTGRSSLYYDRLNTIFQLLLQLKATAEPGRKINSAEVGVYKGGTSFFIVSAAERLGLNVTHRCFDTFEGHAALDINAAIDSTHRPAHFSDASYEDVQRYLGRYPNVIIYKGRFQDTCRKLGARTIQFAHLDMDIYGPTLFALNYLDRNLRVGGIMLVDDYGFVTCPGIELAVNEFSADHPHYFGLSLLTGQYVLVKLRDRGLS